MRRGYLLGGEISTMKNQGFVIIENYKSAYVSILERDIIGDSWSDAIHLT